jgi:hypothetical protein
VATSAQAGAGFRFQLLWSVALGTLALVFLVEMAGRLSAVSGTTLAGSVPAGTCATASNYAHTQAGRAYQQGGYAWANGSGQNMGLWNVFVTTTLKQTGPNYYVIGTCP